MKSKAIEIAEKAYDMLANGEAWEHITALNMLDEARKLDTEAVLNYEWDLSRHEVLTIVANKKSTIIYLEDQDGGLVQQEKGEMRISVLPGIYFVYFGKKKKVKVDLSRTLNVRESDL